MRREARPRRPRPAGAPTDPSGSGAPVSVEIALRRVRILAGVLVAIRLLASADTREVLSWPWVLAIAGAFFLINVVSLIAQRSSERTRTILGVVQLAADTLLVLIVLWVRSGDSQSADWAILVLPVLEGAIRFQLIGAIASWAALLVGYIGWNAVNDFVVPLPELAQRLTVVFLVALPSGLLNDQLVAEIASYRRQRDEAERRGSLLRAAALGGQKSTSLDVDEILDVLRDTVGQMGFADPMVFDIDATPGSTVLVAKPIRGSRGQFDIPPGDPRLAAAGAARDEQGPVVWPRDAELANAPARYSVLVAVPVATGEDGVAVLTARWPSPGAPPASQCESLELFAAQAGASLHNAQTHRQLQSLKDRLAHEAAHDALTDLPNRRRFHEQLERVCGRGRHGDTLAVLFLDLDGFKEVNDAHGHDSGNELLVQVAKRLRNCVRPGDIVARMGGDEFTVMLTRLETPAPAVEVAERICDMLTEPFDIGGTEIRISTSIGISLAPADAADPGDLVRRADVAMYRAKRQGKAGWAMDPGSLDQSTV